MSLSAASRSQTCWEIFESNKAFDSKAKEGANDKEYEETIRKLKGKKTYEYDYNDYPEEHAHHILLKKQREPRYGHQYYSRPNKDNFEYKDIYATGGVAGAGGSLNGSIDLRERIVMTARGERSVQISYHSI